MRGLFCGGSAARYMRSMSIDPAIDASFICRLSKNAKPIPRSPAIKSQSTHPCPARPWKKSVKGPCVALERNPDVGDPPCIQEFSALVANPRPKSLSTKAHKKINDKAILSAFIIVFVFMV